MGLIIDAAKAYQQLLPVTYKIILGRKGISKEIIIDFDEADCFHLIGLQHLKDMALNQDRSKIYNNILNGKLSENTLLKSPFFNDIKNRVTMLPYLEDILDNNDNIYKYNERQNRFSLIKADFLIKNTSFSSTLYLFLSHRTKLSKSIESYCCKSFFPDENRDYTQNQTTWTLLYKEKYNSVTDTIQILYNRLR